MIVNPVQQGWMRRGERQGWAGTWCQFPAKIQMRCFVHGEYRMKAAAKPTVIAEAQWNRILHSLLSVWKRLRRLADIHFNHRFTFSFCLCFRHIQSSLRNLKFQTCSTVHGKRWPSGRLKIRFAGSEDHLSKIGLNNDKNHLRLHVSELICD